MKRPALLLLLLSLLMIACGRNEPAQPAAQAGGGPSTGNPPEGQRLIAQYGCTTCHMVPGTGGMQGTMGPSLAGLGSKPTLSMGSVPNTPANLAQFIQNPASLNPQSSMPPIGMPAADAGHIAAYLLTLK